MMRLNGPLGMNFMSFLFHENLLISLAATVPGLNLCGFRSLGVSDLDFFFVELVPAITTPDLCRFFSLLGLRSFFPLLGDLSVLGERCLRFLLSRALASALGCSFSGRLNITRRRSLVTTGSCSLRLSTGRPLSLAAAFLDRSSSFFLDCDLLPSLRGLGSGCSTCDSCSDAGSDAVSASCDILRFAEMEMRGCVHTQRPLKERPSYGPCARKCGTRRSRGGVT